MLTAPLMGAKTCSAKPYALYVARAQVAFSGHTVLNVRGPRILAWCVTLDVGGEIESVRRRTNRSAGNNEETRSW